MARGQAACLREAMVFPNDLVVRDFSEQLVECRTASLRLQVALALLGSSGMKLLRADQTVRGSRLKTSHRHVRLLSLCNLHARLELLLDRLPLAVLSLPGRHLS